MQVEGALSRSRAIAHRAGVVLGIIIGVFYFQLGMRAFFVASAKNWVELVLSSATVLALLSFGPLSILGIFKPRPAAYGIAGVLALFVGVSVFGLAYGWVKVYWSLRGVVQTFLLGVLPPCTVAGLFFYASEKGRIAPPRDAAAQNPSMQSLHKLAIVRGALRGMEVFASSGKRRHAQWAAVVLGILAGAWSFRWGLPMLIKFVHAGYWAVALGIAATALTLLPVSLLAIFRPRPAAYVALVSVVAALVYPVFGFPDTGFGVGETLGSLLSFVILDLPLAAVAALLFYASGEKHRHLRE